MHRVAFWTQPRLEAAAPATENAATYGYMVALRQEAKAAPVHWAVVFIQQAADWQSALLAQAQEFAEATQRPVWPQQN